MTYRTKPGVVLSAEERTIVKDNWLYWHGARYILWALVVMPDHVHALITPEGASLEQILHTNKSWTAHEINRLKHRAGSVWQDERYDRVIRSDQEWIEKWEYIAGNAVKEGLAESPSEYPWYYEWRDDQAS